MTERNQRPKPQVYVVHDPAARERYRCKSAKAARERRDILRANGRTAYVSPPLPEAPHVSL